MLTLLNIKCGISGRVGEREEEEEENVVSAVLACVHVYQV